MPDCRSTSMGSATRPRRWPRSPATA
jgi:hypothetical protein